MVYRIRESDRRRLNKGRGSRFSVGSRVRQETPEEGRKTRRPKHCEHNNKVENDSLKTLNDKNHQTLSKKFKQLVFESIQIILKVH